jgi:hypothetical protein
MAIVLECNVMIFRKTEIEAEYRGGLNQFRIDWLVKPRERWCEDLSRVSSSSMGPTLTKSEACCYLAELRCWRPL